MAIIVGQLKPTALDALARKPGMHHDGGGLYLRVPPAPKDGPPTSRAVSWVYRYVMAKRPRTMGLGPYPEITLQVARQLAQEARRRKALGEDPIEARNAEKLAKANRSATALTFKQCAQAYIRSMSSGWKNAKHAKQWEATLETYAYPIIGNLPVAQVDNAAVLRVLNQDVIGPKGEVRRLWEAKTETASRLRGRMEAVLGWAAVGGHRALDNPARWKGQLELQFQSKERVAKVKHQPSLPPAQVPEFVAALRGVGGMGAPALEFLILTAARVGEVIGATWSEFDLEEEVWTVPPERMKAGREHRVPLSTRAVEILKNVRIKQRNPAPDDLVFPGTKPGRGLSDMTLGAVIKRLNDPEVVWGDPRQANRPIVSHGFRASFKGWATPQVKYKTEMVERALAHAVAGQTNQAYDREDLFAERKAMMQAWSDFCTSKIG